MRKLKYKQSKEVLENMLLEKELIVYGKTKLTNEICKKYPVEYIIDKNDELCDMTVEGKKIYTPEKLYDEDPRNVLILITTPEKYVIEVVDTILQIDEFPIFIWNVLENEFLNYFSCHLYDNYDRIIAVQKRLYDDYSKKILREVVNRRIAGVTSGYEDLKIQDEIQYLFAPALYSKQEGCILDCGAYIGDTLDRFINRLGNCVEKVYAFEALPENIDILVEKKELLSKIWSGEIAIIPYAVAEKESELIFYETAKRGACFLSEFRETAKYKEQKVVKELKVRTVKIDNIISTNEKIRYIKMDIEGAEYEALQGAELTIKREKPGLAISIYHNAMDYYGLAELLFTFVPEYKFAVRHHKSRHVDTVLYAWI